MYNFFNKYTEFFKVLQLREEGISDLPYFKKFITRLTISSFSAGLLSAIIIVNATRVLSAIRLTPFSNSQSFLSRKYRNIVAAILLFPSLKE